MPLGSQDVFNRISNEYYQLTVSEKKVADYVVSHQRDTQFSSISSLAEACGVAEATISRFCRRLHFKSYSDFKLAIANTMAQRPSDIFLAGELTPDDSVPDMCQKLYSSEIDALSQTLAIIRSEDISAAADIIISSKRVMCMGQGGSMIMAMEAAHLFSTAMPGFMAVGDSHMQMITTATMNEEDTVLFFSYSGSTKDLIDLLTAAKERGSRIILITHFPKSPATAFADIILQCGSNEGPLQLGSVPARMAQLFLIDILFTEVCRRNEIAAQEVREQVASALSSKHL